ncbi:MAG TPA: DUF4956 domain-containing protein [Pyrinomonadaceae bacterium]|nr:DUF4956 domain-containing protein [Pyrinomonadaceae bacterium]
MSESRDRETPPGDDERRVHESADAPPPTRAATRAPRPASDRRSPGMNGLSLKTVGIAAGAALLGFLLMAYLFSGRDNAGERRDAPAAESAQTQEARPDNTNAAARREEPREMVTGGRSLIEQMFAPDQPSSPAPQEPWSVTIPRVLVRLVLAALLAALLAYRPRRSFRVIQRNPYVAQTQILLAVVAAALMMIVGDSAARAFGIFAAASLVRFRTNISDPKEITVLLVSLGIGLACGVGHWEIALVLALFVLPLLWLLEYYEPAQAFRAMELKVRTHDVAKTQRVLKRIFRKYRFLSEIRQLDPADPDEPIGELTYLVNVSLDVSTDQISREVFALDSNNIESIEWEQSKGSSYIYK